MKKGSVPSAPGPRAHAAFTRENGEFRRLVTRGALLELVTFGFYRFWLATNIRRHLWSNSLVAGDALEYTGTARELLIGFLFALAILVPIYLAYFVIGIEAERWQDFASVPLGLLYYGFWQFAAYRARRYRLTRTFWRGVRFWMTGSATAYALRSFGWILLTVLTLGLAYPWRAAALERYKMGHTFYGDLPGRFEGKGWDFFKRGWWLWGLALLALWFSGFWRLGLLGLGFSGDVDDMDAATYEALVAVVGISAGASMPVFPFLYAAFKATEWKWWILGLRFGQGQGGGRFDSDLTGGALIVNIWKMIGVGLLVALAAAIVSGILVVSTFKLGPVFEIGRKNIPLVPAGAVILTYLGSFLALGVVWRIYMVQRIWKLVVASISIKNLDAADHVVAKGEAASALGEGLADSLDVAGF